MMEIPAAGELFFFLFYFTWNAVTSLWRKDNEKAALLLREIEITLPKYEK